MQVKRLLRLISAADQADKRAYAETKKAVGDFIFKERNDVVTAIDRCTKLGHIDLANLLSRKIDGLRSSDSILTAAGIGLREHAVRWKLALASGDTFAAVGLAATLSPAPRSLRQREITRADILEAGKHATAAIPRIIHQVWIGPKPCPVGSPERWRAWCAKYGYEYRLWTQPDVETLACYGSHAYDFFLKQGRYAGTVDVIRADILHDVGGLYVDMDMFPVDVGAAYHDLLGMTGMICIPAKGYRRLNMGALFLTNSILGSTPGHPIMKRYKDAMSPTVASFDGNVAAWWSVGGCLLTSALASSVNVIAPIHLVGSAPRTDVEAIYASIGKIEASESTVLFYSCKFW
ncbi:hypothetical protein METY_1248 [Methylopila sp. Yamaguchi]|nr:hypothetical protein METY_1248 [Methylopila sp. Yamaguchi]